MRVLLFVTLGVFSADVVSFIRYALSVGVSGKIGQLRISDVTESATVDSSVNANAVPFQSFTPTYASSPAFAFEPFAPQSEPAPEDGRDLKSLSDQEVGPAFIVSATSLLFLSIEDASSTDGMRSVTTFATFAGRTWQIICTPTYDMLADFVEPSVAVQTHLQTHSAHDHIRRKPNALTTSLGARVCMCVRVFLFSTGLDQRDRTGDTAVRILGAQTHRTGITSQTIPICQLQKIPVTFLFLSLCAAYTREPHLSLSLSFCAANTSQVPNTPLSQFTFAFAPYL